MATDTQNYMAKRRSLMIGTAALIVVLLAYNINQSIASPEHSSKSELSPLDYESNDEVSISQIGKKN